MISVSIISHNHGSLLPKLLAQLQTFPEVTQIILTLNIIEQLDLPRLTQLLTLHNTHPQGFGYNHNAAFRHCTQPYFCILNPDIEFINNPFPQLLEALKQQQSALIAPKILSKNHYPEDSMRNFPTIQSLTSKLFKGMDGRHINNTEEKLAFPDWVAGMFMLFQSHDFSAINGFDEQYYLYYEDVDICARLHRHNKKIIANLNTTAIHHAQRASHKNLRHMYWHLTSMMRYLWLHRDL